ncbi:MAG: hypothetical protein KDA61_10785 [Planctomycetales bacterium]|nr:hypothetical protein [Planctomycetales bacterium]
MAPDDKPPRTFCVALLPEATGRLARTDAGCRNARLVAAVPWDALTVTKSPAIAVQASAFRRRTTISNFSLHSPHRQLSRRRRNIQTIDRRTQCAQLAAA